MNRLCKVGDVIRSHRFHVWHPDKNGFYSLCDVSQSGKLNPNGNDWLVVETAMTGGGGSHNDVYPDGHHVKIRMFHGFDSKTGDIKLDKGGLSFYQSGCFNGMIYPNDIEFVSELKKEVKETWSK